ncbi:MAG TPA: roadblock/LC7 domain-containing protein [archaeon]|jgi:predicted regulator of Ras-like GTPase activity (Roadblock/LC7/MglB family)|nr:roadblock/LC7 domain-containing protein [archaeon]
MESTIDMLEKVLTNLKNIGGVEASAAASRDGLLMKAIMPKDQHAETFAAMSATMLGAAETATNELGKGMPDRVIVESEHGKLIATGAGPKALLIVLTTADAGLGLILVELEKAAKEVKEFL